MNTKILKGPTIQRNSFEKNIYRFKIIMVGNLAVGKSSILTKFKNNKFNPKYQCTINVDIQMDSINIDEENIVDLQIWDTCGQETFRNLTRQYYNNSQGCLLVFDLTDRYSFEKLEDWIKDIQQFGARNCVVMLVGNKADLINNRVVSFDEASELAKKYQLDYIETSAKNGMNISFIFTYIASVILKNNQEEEYTKNNINYTNGVVISNNTIIINNNCDHKKKCCW
jgi:small GTP-binding protein